MRVWDYLLRWILDLEPFPQKEEIQRRFSSLGPEEDFRFSSLIFENWGLKASYEQASDIWVKHQLQHEINDKEYVSSWNSTF